MTNEIICCGDSITGWNRSQGDERIKLNYQAYPRYLQDKINEEKIDLKVINEGYDGARSREAGEIIGKYLYVPYSKYFIINFGTNDIHDEVSNFEKEYKLKENIKLAIRLVEEYHKQPILMNLYYLDYDSEKLNPKDKLLKDEYNSELKEYCDSKNIPLVDLCSKILPKHLGDGVHPNELGARMIAQEVYKKLKPLI